MQNLKTILNSIDSNLEQFKSNLILLQGGDPGHDIGDSGSALELLSNIITERNSIEETELTTNITKVLHKPRTEIKAALNTLSKLTSEQWTSLFNELYPNDKPYSGFGPAW